MRRYVAQLAAFALHAQVRNAAAFLVEVFDQQLGQFFASERVIQKDRKNRPVSFSFQGVRRWGIEQLAHLAITQRRGLALIAVHLGTLDSLHRVVRHRVTFA